MCGLLLHLNGEYEAFWGRDCKTPPRGGSSCCHQDLARGPCAIDPHGSARLLVKRVATPGPWVTSSVSRARAPIDGGDCFARGRCVRPSGFSNGAGTRGTGDADCDSTLSAAASSPVLPSWTTPTLGLGRFATLSQAGAGKRYLRESSPPLAEPFDACGRLVVHLDAQGEDLRTRSGVFCSALARLITDRARICSSALLT